MTAADEGGAGPVIRDNRRIDPASGQPRRGKHAAAGPTGTSGSGRSGGGGQHRKGNNATRKAAANAEGGEATANAAASSAAAEKEAAVEKAEKAEQAEKEAIKKAEDLKAQLAERTVDLQRLQAEYTNYRKRVDRDRATVRELAIASSLNELLPVLDAIGQAREHGELSGGFKSVADSLQTATSKLGLVSYGERGDAFDPKIHEALSSSYSPDVTEETCVEIFQPGYRIGERILRPARVAVAEPATGPDGASNAPEPENAPEDDAQGDTDN
ncbi:MAG: nucleotide exchange factor GrpE [Nocardiopsaceae bacterium]|nr:nucleotide exchange factor GrpE [Nocardiopsaceae bacterium]